MRFLILARLPNGKSVEVLCSNPSFNRNWSWANAAAITCMNGAYGEHLTKMRTVILPR